MHVAECKFQSNGADRELPADCEASHSSMDGGGVAVSGTQGLLQRCVFAENTDNGLVVVEKGSARVEGCQFIGNEYDIFVEVDSVLYTDTPALANSLGCSNCSASKYGPVGSLSKVPTGLPFPTGTDTAFVALQLVRPLPPHYLSSQPRSQTVALPS
jgi:hypothetical protein